MITNPKNINFESQRDVFDYVTKGLPPTKKNFETLKLAVNNPIDDTIAKTYAGKQAAINSSIMSEEDIKVFKNALDVIYQNRIKNTKTTLLAFAGIFVAGLLIGGSTGAKMEKEKLDNDN